MIELRADDGHTFSAYRAEPEGKPRGAVVVVQEIFGVNAHIRRVADGYAEAGYVAIAPAIFDRKQRDVDFPYDASGIERGRAIAYTLDLELAMRDLRAACNAVSSAGKIGTVGYCFGGAIVWVMAARLSELSCAVSYYGSQIVRFVDEAPKIPTMMHVGERDASFPMEKVREIGERHPSVVIHAYDAVHGFNCDERGSYDAAASALARERTLAFFAEHLALS